MELKHRMLKELKLGKPLIEPTKLLFSDDEIRALSELFFRDAGILAVDGSTMSEQQKFEAMKHIISFAQQVRYVQEIKCVGEEAYCETLCSSGSFRHYFGKTEEFKTVSDGDCCFDGGGGNYELVETGHFDYRYLRFSMLKDIRWDEIKIAEKYNYDMHWQYYGDNEDDSISILVNNKYLYLLDPFGMKGIFVYEQGEDIDIEGTSSSSETADGSVKE